MRTALITGITGQDGAYLSQFLLDKGYHVVGLLRRSASSDVIGERLRWLGVLDRIELVDGDLTDLSSLIRLFSDYKPDEVYNLAAQSFVATSWQQPLLTGQVTGMGAVNMLEALRIGHPTARFYQASSSEMFGKIQAAKQSETTPFYPRSPYAAAKLYAHWMTVNYRESFGMHASSGILFNHESPLRGIEFVTRRITDGVARIKLGLAKEPCPSAIWTPSATGAMRATMCRRCGMMLQQDAADDYVIATGITASVREFCELAFAHAGLRAEDYVQVDPSPLPPRRSRCAARRCQQGGAEIRLAREGHPRRARGRDGRCRHPSGTAVPAKTILVTGAGGFVGSHLLPALRAAFPERAHHRHRAAQPHAGLIALDITQRDAVAPGHRGGTTGSLLPSRGRLRHRRRFGRPGPCLGS